MDEEVTSFSQTASKLHQALASECLTSAEVQKIKGDFQQLYTVLANSYDDYKFLNWGLWNKKIWNEYQSLNFNFSKLCMSQDIYSKLLLYYLIRPLIKHQCFNKRLLDVGCGNGIGLSLSSELLRSKYAVGVDLVNQLTTHAQTNYYIENKVNYIQADAEHLPISDGCVDVVTNLESSHLYPRIEHFFAEVERVLAPNGFFCYADIHFNNKQQAKRLEDFIKQSKTLKIVMKQDITKMVQASIYQRVIVNEDTFCSQADVMFHNSSETFLTEFFYLVGITGISFIPWWKIWFKTPVLKPIAKMFRQYKWCWGKKYYFYYLIQKSGQ